MNDLPEETSELSLAETGATYTVLLVDDNEELLQILNSLFSPVYNVLLARNGKEGLEKARSEKPDIIVSDIMMPEMSGTEMCLKIKNDFDICHIPVILLTALGSAEQSIEGLQRGADDYISKPFNAKVLLAVATTWYATASSCKRSSTNRGTSIHNRWPATRSTRNSWIRSTRSSRRTSTIWSSI